MKLICIDCSSCFCWCSILFERDKAWPLDFLIGFSQSVSGVCFWAVAALPSTTAQSPGLAAIGARQKEKEKMKIASRLVHFVSLFLVVRIPKIGLEPKWKVVIFERIDWSGLLAIATS